MSPPTFSKVDARRQCVRASPEGLQEECTTEPTLVATNVVRAEPLHEDKAKHDFVAGEEASGSVLAGGIKYHLYNMMCCIQVWICTYSNIAIYLVCVVWGI